MNEPVQPSVVWGEAIKVRSYEVDFSRQATVESVCHRFVEAAWNHAEALGVGYSQLAAQGKLWVLSRLLIKVDRQPRWGEEVRLQTWPRGAKSLLAMRDFEVRDSTGAKMLGGSSAWVVLDARSHRPQRIESLLAKIHPLAERRGVDRDPEKLHLTNEPGRSFSTTVRYSDVDVNRHVNSARYIGLLLDAYDLEFHESNEVIALEVNYLGETRGGQTVSVNTASSGPTEFDHTICNSSGAEVCRARLGWRKREKRS